MPARTDESPTELVTRLRQLATLFTRLGFTAFGGPAAHIAMMRQEVVVRRQWLNDQRFLDLLAAANVIPGPTSTELAIHIGWERGRWLGLLVAGVTFIVPAMLITGALGWLYVAYGSLPEMAGVLYGIKPIMVVIVLQALWGLLPKAAATTPLRVSGLAAFAALLLGAGELIVLFGTGLAAAALAGARPSTSQTGAACLIGAAQPAVALVAKAVTTSGLFTVFVKIGSVLFGSGYVLLAFLRADLVERLGWLSEAQLLDAIAVGQVTPGPVFTTATFIGYVLDGPSGALAATAGIFLPAFVFVALLGPLVPRLRRNRMTAAFLGGVTVASVALMVEVTVQLGRAALGDVWTVLIAATAFAALLRWRINATWLIVGGALAGLVIRALDG